MPSQLDHTASLELVPIRGIPEIAGGADLGQEILVALAARGVELRSDDVLVVASKIVSKSEARGFPESERAALLAGNSSHVVARRALPGGGSTVVVHSAAGPVMAAAGIDRSNVPAGTVLLLPEDADASARGLRARLAELAGVTPGIIVSDTAGRPWRQGVSDFALGVAGIRALEDLRGTIDGGGRELGVTVRALADQAAAAADLTRDKAAGVPVVLLRGCGLARSGADAAPSPGRELNRTGPDDWFRYGHVEAVRAALGIADGAVAPPHIEPAADTRAVRIGRMLELALDGAENSTWSVAVVEDSSTRLGIDLAHGAAPGPADYLEAGALAERLVVAAFAEDLPAPSVSVEGLGDVTPALTRAALRRGEQS